jgi:hypothetical protein
MDDAVIDGLCNRLQENGDAMFTDPQGRRMFLVLSSKLSFATAPSILLSYEGEGAFLWEISSRLSSFRLIEAGFSLRLAPTLADVLNRLGARMGDSVALRGTSLPMLEGPKG